MVLEWRRYLMLAAGLLSLAPRLVSAQDFHAVPPAVRHAVSGGSWRLGTVRGHHRLLVIGGDPGRDGPRLIIQWIEETADSVRGYVRQTQPIHAVEAPWVLGVPHFVESANGTRATVTGTNPRNNCHATWIITIGPPGQYGVQPDRFAPTGC